MNQTKTIKWSLHQYGIWSATWNWAKGGVAALFSLARPWLRAHAFQRARIAKPTLTHLYCWQMQCPIHLWGRQEWHRGPNTSLCLELPETWCWHWAKSRSGYHPKIHLMDGADRHWGFHELAWTCCHSAYQITSLPDHLALVPLLAPSQSIHPTIKSSAPYLLSQ